MGDESDPFDIKNLRSPEAEAAAAAAKADIEARKRDGKNLPPELAAKLRAHRGRNSEPTPQASRDDRFVQIPVKALVAAAKLSRNKQWLVLLAVHDRIGKDESSTIELGNKTLKEWGVDRRTKYRALDKLAKLDGYTVERRDKGSPSVTVREDLTILPGRRRRRGQ